MDTLPLALAARRRDLDAGLRPVPPLMHLTLAWPIAGGGTVFGPLSAAQLADTLGQLLRHDEFVLALLLDRPTANLRLTARRALDRASRAPLGVSVDAIPSDPRSSSLTVALRLIAATTRSRSAAAWRAIDELERQGGNAERAAQVLACTGQAVRGHRQRSHHVATVGLSALLEPLLALPQTPSLEPTESAPGSQPLPVAKSA